MKQKGCGANPRKAPPAGPARLLTPTLFGVESTHLSAVRRLAELFARWEFPGTSGTFRKSLTGERRMKFLIGKRLDHLPNFHSNNHPVI